MIHNHKGMKIHYEGHLDGDGREAYPAFLKAIDEKIGRKVE